MEIITIEILITVTTTTQKSIKDWHCVGSMQ
jgi:hypothetical protein